VLKIHTAASNTHLLPTYVRKTYNNVQHPIFCSILQICCMQYQATMCNTLRAAERHAMCCTLLPWCDPGFTIKGLKATHLIVMIVKNLPLPHTKTFIIRSCYKSPILINKCDCINCTQMPVVFLDDFS
jgi:hypothetical protein